MRRRAKARPRLPPARSVEGRVLALGRDGDAMLDAGTERIYVTGAVPGDRIRARTVPETAPRSRPQAAPAVLEAVLEAGPDRREPPCPHFPRPGDPGGCGGCKMQMLEADAYRRWKAGLARDVLERAGVPAGLVGDMMTASERSRRRAGFAVQATAGGCIAGFRGWRSHRIMDLSEACLVCAPELTALLPHLRALGAGLLAPGRGFGADATLTDTGLDLVLVGLPPEADRLQLAGFAEAADLARLSVGGGPHAPPETIVTRRRPRLTFGAVAVTPPAGGFLQAVPEIEAAMQAEIAGWLANAGRVLDLFAGCGTLSLPLLDTATVQAVDSSEPALAALREGADAAGRGSRVVVACRDLLRFPLTGPELAGQEAVILDPPRQGAAAQAAALAAATAGGGRSMRRLTRLAAVSCNPVSLARDLAILQGAGWSVSAVRLYDQFLWTPHLELVALLQRRP